MFSLAATPPVESPITNHYSPITSSPPSAPNANALLPGVPPPPGALNPESVRGQFSPDGQGNPSNSSPPGFPGFAAESMPLASEAASGWSIVNSPPNPNAVYNTLDSVTCVSASDCWAVGQSSTGTNGVSQALIEHWDGTSWAIVSSSNTSLPPQGSRLLSVTCVSASDCWAVGWYFYHYIGQGTTPFQTLIERWDGTAWTIVSSPDTSAAQYNYLYGVTCVSASDCWAVGHYVTGQGGTYQTLIERWDGTAWAIVTSPNTSTTRSNYLYGVTCVSASDCWAVGAYDAGGIYQTVIERWNGTAWAIVTSPNGGSNTVLAAVTCVSASNCLAVGYHDLDFVYQTLIERWDGTAWTIDVTSANTNATQNNLLFGVTCLSASNCWAVGYYAPAAPGSPRQTLIERWDGTSWAIVTSPNTSAMQSNFLVGVTCVSASDCWAVGYYYDANGFGQTLIERYTASPPIPTSVLSRKTHGGAGIFDVNLPITGTPGVECRSGGSSGDHQVVLTFAAPVTVSSATVTPGTGGSATVSGAPVVNGSQITVNLTNVSNAQTLTINLIGVSDDTNIGDVSVPMSVLLGDTSANGLVNSTDVSQTQSQSGQPVTSSNFRTDVSVNGLINSTDVSIVQSKSGTGLP